MEPTNGTSDHPLIDLLAREGPRFEFFHAAVQLYRVLGPEAVRLAGSAGLGYPVSEIETADDDATLRVGFMGLTGVCGVLPQHYSELLATDLRNGGVAFQRFFDIFNHRALGLLVDAHIKPRFWLQQGLGRNNAVEDIVFSICGMAIDETRDRGGIPREAFPYYAGLLAQQPRASTTLEAILEDVLGAEVAVEEFTGAWVEIPGSERNSLSSNGKGSRLSTDLFLGDRYYDPSASFRIHVKSLDYALFAKLMPGQKVSEALERFVRFALGPGQAFDYVLELDPDDLPDAELTTADDARQRLGWSMWLRSGDTKQPARAGPFYPAAIDEAGPVEPELVGRS